MDIVILGAADDPQAARVRDALAARGAAALQLDGGAFPASSRWRLDGEGLWVGGERVPAPAAVYVRGLGGHHPLAERFSEDLASRPHGLIAQCDEVEGFLASMLGMWAAAGARLVNDLEANRQHQRKPLQLRMLAAAGAPVPRWTATNDPEALRDFARALGRVVYKPLAGGALARLLDEADLRPERLAGLALAPVLFQQYLPGTTVRAYAAGGRVVAAAELPADSVDSREAPLPPRATRLTDAEEAVVLRAAAACRMAFTAVDAIRGADAFHVLECNPSPMFAAFEDHTGQEVAAPLAELLMAR